MIIDASNYDFQELNEILRGVTEDCTINNCLGQRFMMDGLKEHTFTINGVPGNALGAYMSGANVIVNGNAQDAVGDTMNDGTIVIHGNAGDAVGYAMRGGRIFVEKNVGYRAGIHMKAYKEKIPVIIIGGGCGCFLGEYQAGGLIILLGLGIEGSAVGSFPGTGMHGGKMFLRGNYADLDIPAQVNICKASAQDLEEIEKHIREYCTLFGKNYEEIMASDFYMLTPNSKNPYKQIYVQN
jgi:glutamate synthase domain-containing protein 3